MAAKIIVIALYSIMIIVFGVIGLRKTKSFSDFFLGGGKVGPWMTAFSYGTAYFSAVLFIGFAGKIGWNFGYSGLWVAFFNAFVGVLGVWGLLGWKIKKMSVEYKISTMNEFLEKRYNSKFLKLFGSISIFIFMIPYSAAVFMGLSYLFKSNFGIEYWQALAFIGLFTAIYMVLGGYKSIAMIDTMFGIIMTIGVCILLFSTLNKGNGLINITEMLSKISPKLTQVIGPPGFWPLFSLVFLTSVAPFAMPQLIQKFYAIKDKKSVRTGMIASTIFAILIGGIAYFIGSTTRIFLSPNANPNAFLDGKPVYDILMPELLSKVIPESLSVLILLLIISASMSTLAAIVLISSSSYAKDFYAGFIKKDISDKNLTTLMRVMNLFFILMSVILAYVNFDTIVAILGISWGAIGSIFLGPFVWGIFSKKMTKFGAISSSLLGLLACMSLYFIYKIPSPQAGTIGMMISLTVNPVFSFLQNLVKSKTN